MAHDAWPRHQYHFSNLLCLKLFRLPLSLCFTLCLLFLLAEYYSFNYCLSEYLVHQWLELFLEPLPRIANDDRGSRVHDLLGTSLRAISEIDLGEDAISEDSAH